MMTQTSRTELATMLSAMANGEKPEWACAMPAAMLPSPAATPSQPSQLGSAG